MPKRKLYALKVFDGWGECVSEKEQRMLKKHEMDEEGVRMYVRKQQGGKDLLWS